MIKIILFLFIFIFNLNAQDSLTAQKQNTLYVQNLIEIEEKIAKNFEKYILTEFELPTMSDLMTDTYLGSNFSQINKMGVDIDFLDTKNLKIKYHITKDIYIDSSSYITLLYNRDLYRSSTSVYHETKTINSKSVIDTSKSYIEIKLKSDEAKNIFDLLKNNYSIQKTCSTSLANTYCSNNQKSIRWYNASSAWIEYSKKDFNKGNVILSTSILSNDTKLEDLIVGAYIFIDGTKYVKMADSTSGLNILKVD